MPVAFLNFCISGFSAKPDAISPFCKDRSAFPFPRCCQKHGIFFICPFIEIAAHIRIKPGNSVTFLLCHQHQQKKTAKHHAQNPKAAAQKQDSIFPEPEYFGELFVWYGKGAKSRQSRHRHRDRTDQIGTDRRLSDDQAAFLMKDPETGRIDEWTVGPMVAEDGSQQYQIGFDRTSD